MAASHVLVPLATLEMESVAIVSLVFNCVLLFTFATHIDIDECNAGTDNCAEGATCMDTDGSFTCTCNAGYTGDGVNCNSKLGTAFKQCAVIQHVLKFNSVT